MSVSPICVVSDKLLRTLTHNPFTTKEGNDKENRKKLWKLNGGLLAKFKPTAVVQ